MTVSNESSQGFLDRIHDKFSWYPDLGLGHTHIPVGEDPYINEPSAFQKFQEYVLLADTEMGVSLNEFRCRLVTDFITDTSRVVDVGVGAGTFLKSCPGAMGYDVSPHGVQWLKDQVKFWDVYEQGAYCVTLWDVFEHLPEPTRLLNMVRKWVFMSLPIFDGLWHTLSSKHYKPKEHRWYFTEIGLLQCMSHAGFELILSSDGESVIGRDHIRSYIFRRIGR